MNDTLRLDLRPEVDAFVDQVRSHLTDLRPEVREELTEGLTADLHELVADRGPEVLGDPADYADELRTAAGLDGPSRGTPYPGSTGQRLQGWLDSNRDYWHTTMQRPAFSTGWELLVVLRPVWWAFRAWVAVQLADLLFGGWPYTPVPSIGGPVLGFLILCLAVVLSVQLGRGRLWPATRLHRSAGARLLLLGLNVFALVMTPVVLGRFAAVERYTATRFVHEPNGPGLWLGSREVTNVFPYDASGRPLVGVQLYDQDGRPLDLDRGNTLVRTPQGRALLYPWTDGAQDRWNVVPLPRRQQEDRRRPAEVWSSESRPALPTPPALRLPPVTLPGGVSTGTSPADPKADGEGVTDPKRPDDRPKREADDSGKRRGR